MLLNQPSHSSINLGIIVFGVLALVWISLQHLTPPEPALPDAPVTSFSSIRAMAHVWRIGAKPHPSGSRENEQVRQYIAGQLRELGLQPEIQSAIRLSPLQKTLIDIHNIAVKVPGQGRADKALLLIAHYDSVPLGPGAADNAASVAAMLETLRVINYFLPLQNDVVFLFTDGEEDGLLGIQAFVQHHPWAKTIGLALNFEYRGNSGAFMMFETSPGNAKLISGLADSVPYVLANSLMYEVYKRMPNDTDFSVLKQAGIPGMNFAAIEGFEYYHTALDRPERLNQGTLQHEGDIMLGLVKYFGNSPLEQLTAANHVYFDIPWFGLVHYPEQWLIPLYTVLIFLFSAAMIIGIKAKQISWRKVLAGTAVFPVIVITFSLINYFLWLAIRFFCYQYLRVLQANINDSAGLLLAFIALDIGLFLWLLIQLNKWLKTLEFLFGALTIWLILLGLCSMWYAGASFILYWPLAAMLPGVYVMLIFSRPVNSSAYPIIILLASAPGIIIFTALIKNLLIALTIQSIALLSPVLMLICGLVLPAIYCLSQKE